ncbi:MAG: hypothetical protein MK207_08605 [Saprospiraceae bacterium]|nr:hypothetical protein [Saprospiraceae bacterium]
MNNFIFPLILLFLCCCGNSDKKNISETDAFASPLSFNIDYKGWDFAEPKSYTAFNELFVDSNSVRFDNIDINKANEKIYKFHQNLGDVVIVKESKNTFALLERFIIPIGSVYGKFALIRYMLNVESGTIYRDKTFIPQLDIYKYWSNHVVKEYDSYLNDPRFTAKNVKEIPHVAFNAMRFLMFNLTLATIMERCKECQERMNRIENDFPFVLSTEYSQNLMVCKSILSKFSS